MAVAVAVAVAPILLGPENAQQLRLLEVKGTATSFNQPIRFYDKLGPINDLCTIFASFHFHGTEMMDVIVGEMSVFLI